MIAYLSTLLLLCSFTVAQVIQPTYLTTYEWGTSQDDYVTSTTYHTAADVIYAAGYTKGSLGAHNLGNTDAFVSVLPLAAGPLTLQWGTEFEDRATAVAYDPTRKLIHVVGWTSGLLAGVRSAGAEDGFISTITMKGATAVRDDYQWGTAGGDKPVCAFVDPFSTSTVYVAGTTSGSFSGYSNMGGDDAFVSIKNSLNTFTNYQWGTKSSDAVGGCAFDTTTGVFYVVGSTPAALPGFNNSGGYDAFATVVSRAGKLTHIQWGTSYSEFVTGAVFNQRLKALMVVGYTGGSFGDTTSKGAQDAFLSLITFNSDGSYSIKNQQWGTIGNDVPTSVTTDVIYNAIYVSGYTSGQFPGAKFSGGLSDAFLSVFAASNPEYAPTNLQWGTNETDQCVAVAASPSNQNVYCTGWTTGIFPIASSISLVPGGTQLFASGIRKDILPVPTAAPTAAPASIISGSAMLISPIASMMLFVTAMYIIL